ncbi:MAG: 6-phospho-beta-glucosidase [Lachnospiraceae bacterium]|jgi:6-phospho-beta-glucosidase|nr:6-phospho-beta-glucosidase [Lachnospiraceae bacterium]
MKKLKATIIGAGSTYTPELIEGFTARKEILPFTEFALMDIDEKRLAIVGGLAERQMRAAGYEGDIVLTTDLDQAIDEANFVFGQLRVGKMAARIVDEKIPLKYGCLGQETTGAGGFMKALRTIPVMMDIVERMKKLAADDAWMVNFSNPSGIIAQAVLTETDAKMIGLCNCAINMLKEIEDKIGTKDFDYEYLGLNHLSFITSVIKHGDTENLVAALADQGGQTMKNVPEIDYEPALLRAIPYIPSSYLSYFYTREQQINKCREAEQSRGEECLDVENALLEQYSDLTLTQKPTELEKRGGSLYSTAAVSVAEAIYCDKKEVHVIAAKNDGAMPFMRDDDVIEVKCRIGKDGVVPQPVSVYNEYVIGLMQAVKSYERLTVKAALDGDREAALAALMVHPLIGDYDKAAPMLNEMLEANREYLPRFFT